ncbi:pentatricopeptide repeat-containing protein At2g22410, mitochondrial [Punica granatum]|uniref:Pentatricopeptide repeat-containing protein At2g22410, mitochondrial n=2 Tax=Punica granatum TaxID=22663 RepID=A0A6P8E7Y3_PUNGR|nr:pentatricopeptide repeat-containing protein At2g22410, mitochondrial [Punica granatum]XP_031401249.1 pentatricopeptide repeat-containing protein At2g22410, mitochondrial [Punica granatum]
MLSVNALHRSSASSLVHRLLPPSHLHTRPRSAAAAAAATATWNTTHIFVLSNPILSLLERSTSLSHLKQVQAQMTVTGLVSDPLALSRLVAFCAISNSRDLNYCTKILYSACNANAFSWNVAIRGFIEGGDPREAFNLYRQMLRNDGLRPDNYTYPLLLKLCGGLKLKDLGREVLGHVVKLGFDQDLFVHNAVINLLVALGELGDARKLFDGSPVRDLVSWNTLITGYIKGGQTEGALRSYRKMESEGFKPDEVTMIAMVSLCAQVEDLNLGREFHRFIEENQLTMTVPLSNALMDMYVKCGNLELAERIFDNMTGKTAISWTTILCGYAKFGYLDKARNLFDQIPEKNVVPWNALMGGYIQSKRGKEALSLFNEMQAGGIKPDEVTMVHCLAACSQLGALEVGVWVHHYIEKHKLSLNVALGTALVDMYAKCGNIDRALNVFQDMPARNSLTWTAVICGLALHGHAQDALCFFSEMVDNGLKPDDVTFLGVLSACRHAGLVEVGRRFFNQMMSEFNIKPQLEHYSCMVDLLGRAGLLEEAAELIDSLPMKADATIWGSLFFACRVHRNVSLGERVASELLKLNPDDGGNYVLLANIYGEANMWEEAGKVRKMMRKRGVEKTPGCSSIEVDGIVNEFTVRDKSHPQAESIYECLVQLTGQLCLVDISNEFSLDF